MAYCNACGRVENTNECSCLHKKKISKLDTFVIFLYLMMVPGFMIATGYKKHGTMAFPFMAYGAFSISILLLVLSLLNVVLKKSYLALFFGCHQRKDRSLSVNDYVFPICIRCSGIYIGIFISICLGIFTDFYYIYLVMMAPLLIDGILQKKTPYRSNALKRFTSGLLFAPGFVLVFSVYHYLILYIITWMTSS